MSAGKKKGERHEAAGVRERRYGPEGWERVREIVGLNLRIEIRNLPSSHFISQKKEPQPAYL